MKGLAAILAPKEGKPSPFGKEPKSDPMMPVAEEAEEAGSEVEFAKLASEAIAAGDHDAAADALVSLVKACKGYGEDEE